MTMRHQSSRRRSYGPRRHAKLEREGREPLPALFRSGRGEPMPVEFDTSGYLSASRLAERLASVGLAVPVLSLAQGD